MNLFLAFLGVSFIVIATPGPDTAMTIRNTLLGGRRGGVLTALGISVGQTIWALMTSIGLVALLIASEPLFLALKYAGAAYLIYLGLLALREAFRRQAPGAGGTVAMPARRMGAWVAFRQGVISDLGNPKMAVFFASLLPQFVPPENLGGEASFASLMFLGLVFAAMTFAWLALYAALIDKAGDFLRRSRIRRTIEGITGAVLIALGLRVAAEQR